MHPIFEKLLGEKPVLTDGAWGTELYTRGLAGGQPAEAWNLERPDSVEEVARAYVEAGSRVILTNTFQGNRFALERHGLADKVEDLNREGARISKRAAGDHASVFASIGPSGKLLMIGQVTEAELSEAFRIQTAAVADGGADAIVIETMSDPVEARLAVEAARETGLPVVACMCFDSGKDKDHTMMKTTPEEAATELAAAGADAVGANCGSGIDTIVPVCARLHAATELPVWIKVNAGLPELIDGQVVYKTTPEEFAGRVPDLVKAGASFVGGCCGTTPDFIRAAREALAG